MRQQGIHYATGEAIDIEWRSGVIERITPITKGSGLPIVAPGFIDIQINGFGGVNFGAPDITSTDLQRVVERLAGEGVTHFLPTLITDDVARMEGALANLSRLSREPEVKGAVIGFHLEGPYLCDEDGPRGAHPLEFCKDPDVAEFDRLQRSANGMIRMMTIAPERRGAIDFIKALRERGVRVAIGHTAADRATILSAIEAGATLATHLGNAVSDRIQRHRNVIFDELGADDLWASLIVDGHHLPPHVVKIFVRAKGIERTILVSDAVQYAGLAAGVYDGGYRQFDVREDGFISVVGEPRLAGSGLLLRRGVENLIRFAGVSLADGIRTVTENPARWLGLEDGWGRLEVGAPASLVEFDWDATNSTIKIRRVIQQGAELGPAPLQEQ